MTCAKIASCEKTRIDARNDQIAVTTRCIITQFSEHYGYKSPQSVGEGEFSTPIVGQHAKIW